MTDLRSALAAALRKDCLCEASPAFTQPSGHHERHADRLLDTDAMRPIAEAERDWRRMSVIAADGLAREQALVEAGATLAHLVEGLRTGRDPKAAIERWVEAAAASREASREAR